MYPYVPLLTFWGILSWDNGLHISFAQTASKPVVDYIYQRCQHLVPMLSSHPSPLLTTIHAIVAGRVWRIDTNTTCNSFGHHTLLYIILSQTLHGTENRRVICNNGTNLLTRTTNTVRNCLLFSLQVSYLQKDQRAPHRALGVSDQWSKRPCSSGWQEMEALKNQQR